MYVCQFTSPIGYLENRSCTYVCQLTSLVKMNVIQYADMHHPCVVRILWSMLTYITNGYLENGSCIYMYVNIAILKVPHMFMSTDKYVCFLYICQLYGVCFLYIYVNLHHLHTCMSTMTCIMYLKDSCQLR